MGSTPWLSRQNSPYARDENAGRLFQLDAHHKEPFVIPTLSVDMFSPSISPPLRALDSSA